MITTLQNLTIQFIQVLQSFSPALDPFMESISFLGRIEFYLIVLPFIFWCLDRSAGFRSLLMLIFVDLAGSNLKLWFHQPRPYWIGDVKAISTEISYGLPSTHSSDSLGVWGYLSYRARRNWLKVLASLLIFLIGLSRLFLGVHFLHDVIIGWLIGLLVLWIFTTYEDRISRWASRQSFGNISAAAFLLSLVIIAIGIATQFFLKGIVDPTSWSSFSTQSRNPTYTYTLAGALFGAMTGMALMRRRANFLCDGVWYLRIFRYLVGIIGLLIFYFGLDMLFAYLAPDVSILGFFLRYVRYAFATFWVTFIAPWLFIKLHLAQNVPSRTGNN